jgi:Uncharacterized lipoprotein
MRFSASRSTDVLRALLALGGLFLGGCAFGTNRVTLPASAQASLPPQGEQVAVHVKDARADLSGAQVGFKRNGYGAKTGTVALSDNEILSDRIARDLTALLRQRGYRAFELKDLPAEQADLVLMGEVSSFLVDVKQGFWSGDLEAFAVIRLRAIQAHSRKPVWDDVVRVEAKKGLMAVMESDHQEVIEQLYASLVKKLQAELPSEFPR